MANDTNGDTRGTSSESRGFGGTSSSSSSGGTANSSGAKSEGGSDSRTNSSSSSSSGGMNSSGSKASGADSTNAGRSGSGGNVGTSASQGSKNSSGAKAEGGVDSRSANAGSVSNSIGGFAQSVGKALSSVGDSIAHAFGMSPDSFARASTINTDGMTANQATAARTFAAAGLSANGIAAMMGQFGAESGFNPKARAKGDANDGTDSVGLAQWNSSRLSALNSFAKTNGLDPNSAQTQASFAVHELQTTHKDIGAALSDPNLSLKQATDIAIGYEAPKGYTKNNPAGAMAYSKRQSLAQGFANQISGTQDTDVAAADPFGVMGLVQAQQPVATTSYVDPQVVSKTAANPNPDQPKSLTASQVAVKAINFAMDPVGFALKSIENIGKSPAELAAQQAKEDADPFGLNGVMNTLGTLAKNGQSYSADPSKEKGTRNTVTTPDQQQQIAATDTSGAQNPLIQAPAATVANPLLTPATLGKTPFGWSTLENDPIFGSLLALQPTVTRQTS